ncbi:MAG: hypothetical protein HZC47_00170 [Methanobacterium sp.]|uniref:hypothetical protein n=1 Tax=Methanobacterium sp. TaxID=2164 RepID=UPI003D65A627|nr:hypothetical protein [Methanobacterium sp.]
MHLKPLNIIGILMMLFAAFLLATHYLDQIILSITYPFLEGSSKGKSVLLFGLMGSMLLFYPLFKQKGTIANKISSINPKFSFDGHKYLKFTIIIILFTYLFGILLEFWVRFKFGVSPFTMFISFNPEASTTSITHSHIFKSILGYLIQVLGIHVPSGVNTGLSIAQYIPIIAFAIFIMFPLVYLTGLIALSQKRDFHKVIIAFSLTVSLIGMLDGGLFSTPALLGLFGLLLVYFVKNPLSVKGVIAPWIIIILFIILRFSIGIVGTNTDFHEITVINPSDNIDINGYTVLSLEKIDNKMIIKVPGNIHDKLLLSSLTDDLKGKCDGFFLSWNAYVWI